MTPEKLNQEIRKSCHLRLVSLALKKKEISFLGEDNQHEVSRFFSFFGFCLFNQSVFKVCCFLLWPRHVSLANVRLTDRLGDCVGEK